MDYGHGASATDRQKAIALKEQIMVPIVPLLFNFFFPVILFGAIFPYTEQLIHSKLGTPNFRYSRHSKLFIL